MKKYILLIIFLIMLLGATSCSGNSLLESGSSKTSAEQEFVTVTSEEEKNTETFLNEIMAETAVSSDNAEDNMTDNTDDGANITEKSDINTTTTTSISSVTYETITESINTETNLYDDSVESSADYFNNITYEFTGESLAADVNDYVDKEIAAIVAFIVNRSEIYEEYWGYYSALIFYTDGTCASGVFRDEHGIHKYLGNFTTIYDADEIICFDVIGSIDPDISEQLNECLNLIDLNSEWAYYDGYKPYDPNEPEAYPAVVVTYDYDLVHFLDNEVNIFSSYKVKPLKKFEDAILYAELDDNYSKEIRDFFIKSDIVNYWLENYAWKIGE